MKTKRIVYIPIEVKVREFDGKFLLATELASRGYRVIIGRNWQIDECLYTRKNGVIIWKNLTKQFYTTIKKCHSDGMIQYSMEEESFTIGSDERYMRYKLGKDTLQELDGVFCSGIYEKRLVDTVSPDSRDKSYAVGNPRLDLLGERISIYYPDEIKKIMERNGRIILVVSNGVFFDLKNQIANIQYTQGRELTNKEIKKIKDDYNYRGKVAVTFAAWIKQLSSIVDRTIVFRPHPSDDTKKWIELFRDVPNIIIDNRGSINMWLGVSEILVHTGCTTALEAYLSSVPSIMCKIMENSDYTNTFPNDLSLEVETYEELEEYVDLALKHHNRYDYFNKEKEKILAEHITTSREELCVKRIADIIERDVGKELVSAIQGIKPLRQIKQSIRWIMNDMRKETFTGTYKWHKPLSNSEVQETINHARITLGLREQVRCRRITRDLYQLDCN